MAEEQMPHQLSLEERSRLTMTGVTEVVSFEDTSVVLHTALGTLTVHGQGLQLKELSLEGGQIQVDGQVSALIYEDTGPARGWLGRLFG